MNKNKLYLSALAIALVLLFSSATFPVTTVKADSGYFEVPDGLEIGGRIDVAKVYWKYDESNLYLNVEYDGNHTDYTRWEGAFYIDSDMNASTGISGYGIGADYWIIYHWFGGSSYCELWSLPGYSYIKDLSLTTDSTWVEIIVPLADIGSPTSGVRFYLCATSALYDWIEATATYNKGTPVTITIDGNPSDWTGISPIITDPSGELTEAEHDVTAIYMTNSATHLYIRQDTQSPPNTTLPPSSSNSIFAEQCIIYFDTDQNNTTGQSLDTIGADYLISYVWMKSENSLTTTVDARQWDSGGYTDIPETHEGAVSSTREWSILLSDLNLEQVSTFDIYISISVVNHNDYVPDAGAITALQPGTPQAFAEKMFTYNDVDFDTVPALLGTPLDQDSDGNYLVDVVLAGKNKDKVSRTHPGQIYAHVNVTSSVNASVIQVVDILPVDWQVKPGKAPGGVMVLIEGGGAGGSLTDITNSANVTIVQPITALPPGTGTPGNVTVSVNVTAATGDPLQPGDSLLVYIKLKYALKGETVSDPTTEYPVVSDDIVKVVVDETGAGTSATLIVQTKK